MMMRPRSNSDEDLVAYAIDCLALWRKRDTLTDEAEADATASLAAIRPNLVALALFGEVPNGLLAAVDAAIGQDLESQWAAPAVEQRG